MRSLVILSAVISALPVMAAQDPQPSFPTSRYDKMLEESPFALATPVAPPAAPKDSFTKDWVLEALSKNRDEQGVERDWVSIRSRDQTQRFQLYGNDPNAEGVSIASVERSPQTGKSKVTLKKGNEFGVVEYDQMLIESPIAASGGDGPASRTGASAPIPGLNPAAGRGPNMNNGRPAIPRPSSIPSPNGAIPQPNANPQQQLTNPGAAPLPGAANAAGDNRRRIRVINSKP
jgi:hypothetical protein